MRLNMLFVLAIAGCSGAPDPDPVAAPASATTTITRPLAAVSILGHAKLLSGNSLRGRGAGSEEEMIVAEYITQEFTNYGLVPAVEDYIQPFPFISAVGPGKLNTIRYSANGKQDVHYAVDRHFRPLGNSSLGAAEGEMVFVGYGISGAEKNYDDYGAVDVSGKIVIMLRYGPEGVNPHSEFDAATRHRQKVEVAKEHGAVAVIFVTGPEEDIDDALIPMKLDRDGGNWGIPVVQVLRSVADEMMAPVYLKIAELQQEINATRRPLSYPIAGGNVRIRTDITPHYEDSRNVLGIWPGQGYLKGQFVIVGAHYDHLGMGGASSGSLEPDEAAVHNGADDNASGTAMLMEIARHFVNLPPNGVPRRSLIFQAYGAGELGQLGSSYVSQNSPVPMDSVVAMINLDMVGRLTDNRLVMGGAGSSLLWKDILSLSNSDSLNLVYDENPFTSDHQPYYLMKKPVLHFFTGKHENYHRPSDDVAHLNPTGMEQVGKLAAAVIQHVAISGGAPEFVSVEISSQISGEINTVLGIIPDYSWTGDGMRITGIRSASPAAKCGLTAGDIVSQIGLTEIKDIYDYVYVLREARPGFPLMVIVRRGEEKLILEVTPAKR